MLYATITLDVANSATSKVNSTKPKQNTTATLRPISSKGRRGRPIMTAPTRLKENPFNVLKVTPRHTKQEIIEAAEDASLTDDPARVSEARAILTNPKNRIQVELSWLPGLSPRRAQELSALVEKDPLDILQQSNIPRLARANLLADFIASGALSNDAANFGTVLDALTDDINSSNLEDLMRDINEERTVSGFQPIGDFDLLSEYFDSHILRLSDAVGKALNELKTDHLVSLVTSYAETWTLNGESVLSHFAELVLNGYEVQVHGFLESEFAAISKVIEHARSIAETGGNGLKKCLSDIEKSVRQWDSVAQPIQLLAQARGVNHEVSRELGGSLRSLAIDLHNEYSNTDEAARLSELIIEVFAEVPILQERAEKDLSDLVEIRESQEERKNERMERLKSLAYEAEIGLVFKEVLRLTPTSVSYGTTSFLLDEITRMRWGGVRNSVNGIPTGTEYTIAFGNQTREAVVSTRRGNVYQEFTSRLWKAVGIELLFNIINELRNGRIYEFQDYALADEYVDLTKGGSFFSKSERKRFKWAEVTVSSYSGEFHIAATVDKKFSASMSYIDTANTHVFEGLIRANFKKAGCKRLSDTYAD